jgi:hypothetical protein
MRYIFFYDVNLEDLDTVFECDRQRAEQKDSIPDLLPPHMMATANGNLSGFSVMEVENDEQMAKYIIQFAKAGKRNMRAVPIWETSKTKAIWKQLKK